MSINRHCAIPLVPGDERVHSRLRYVKQLGQLARYRRALPAHGYLASSILLPQGQRSSYLVGIWVIAWRGQRTG